MCVVWFIVWRFSVQHTTAENFLFCHHLFSFASFTVYSGSPRPENRGNFASSEDVRKKRAKREKPLRRKSIKVFSEATFHIHKFLHSPHSTCYFLLLAVINFSSSHSAAFSLFFTVSQYHIFAKKTYILCEYRKKIIFRFKDERHSNYALLAFNLL